jgi:hypothetical protein
MHGVPGSYPTTLPAPSANHRIDPMTEVDNNDGATPNQPVPGA